RGGDRDDAVLERVGGVAAVVLDPQRLHAELAGEVVGTDEAGPADLQVDDGRGGQEAAVAPHRARPGFDRLTGHPPEDGVVVADLQRPEALLTGVAGTEVVGGATLATEQVRGSTE